MRLSSVLAASVVAAPLTLTAQATATPAAGPRVGILAGLSSSTLSGSDVEGGNGIDKRRRNGFVGGLYVVLPVSGSPLSVRPELLYVQKGVRARTDFVTVPDVGGDVAGTVDVALKLDYLELPVLLQFDVPASAGLRPAVYAGPSVAYRVRCRTEASYAGAVESTSCDDTGNTGVSAPRRFDFSGVVGGQIGFALGGQSIGVGVRYTHGFTSIAPDGDVKNRTLSVYGALGLPFGR